MLNLFDFEIAARDLLPTMVFDYYAGGANDEVTLRENRAAFDRIGVQYRVLRGVGEVDSSTTVLGHQIGFPVIVGPAAFHGLAHPDAELATVRAAGAAKTIMVCSTLANQPIEAVCEAASGPVWLQLYVYIDREVSREFVQRAVAAGVQALVVTVDAPVLGRRERDIRNSFSLPPHLSVGNLAKAGKARLDNIPAGSSLARYFGAETDPNLTWDDLAWLRSVAAGIPLLLKGVVHPDDARLAVEHGVDGIIVSNHGGRQLDTSVASIEALDRIAQAVGGQTELLVDGGVRRGTDVLKAIALGAKATLIARPILWGLTVEGQTGAEAVLALLRAEFRQAMALAGARTVDQITRDLIVGGSGSWFLVAPTPETRNQQSTSS